MADAKRPIAITVIGYVSLFFACFMILGNIISYIIIKSHEANSSSFILQESPHRYIKIAAFLSVLFGVFLLKASIDFLKLRAWARKAIEIISWVWIVYVAGLIVFITVRYFMVGDGNLLAIPLIIMGIIMASMGAIPSIAIIYLLRSRSIKDVFGNKTSQETTNK
ncbi:MAG: hypothetical protein WC980_10055 [Candidatus Brocadiia bacterium]